MKMTRTYTSAVWAWPTLIVTGFGLLLFAVIEGFTGVPDIIGQQLTDVIVSSAVFLNGLAVLQLMWKFEMREVNGSLPFAWCYFAIQHLAFGFGGFLVSIADQNYLYQNAFGDFPWNEAITPLLLVHFVSMNIGLVGVWVGTRAGRSAKSGAFQSAWDQDGWPWSMIGPVCLVSLAMHGLVWLLLIDRKLGFITYIVQALSYCTNATFVLWGLVWKQTPWKRLFITYLLILTAVEILRGNRTFFAFPILLFGIGLLISSPNLRERTRGMVVTLPFIAVLFWGFVRSEDLRVLFSRGNPVDLQETVARVQTLAGSDAFVATDAAGDAVNSVFRIGSRLFELSAADVISRTPSAIPFWQWSDDDWQILETGFLPLKLNTDAAANTIDNAGDGYLREYGWVIDREEDGTSMPATLTGDAWRRFGWTGVIGTFFLWSLGLSLITRAVRPGRKSVYMAVFVTGIVANTTFLYTTDILTLVTSVPRRLVVICVYAIITIGFSKLLEKRQQVTAEPSIRLQPSGLRH
jgi:hypothetical protein